MEKEFVPYDESLALKELGFDEDCFGYYVNAELDLTWKFSDCSLYQDTHISILAPTFSQAFRWFRENYDLESSIVFYENYLYQGKTNIYETIIEKRGENSRYFFTPIEGFITYEEAELECLKKLIEIVKSK